MATGVLNRAVSLPLMLLLLLHSAIGADEGPEELVCNLNDTVHECACYRRPDFVSGTDQTCCSETFTEAEKQASVSVYIGRINMTDYNTLLHDSLPQAIAEMATAACSVNDNICLGVNQSLNAVQVLVSGVQTQTNQSNPSEEGVLVQMNIILIVDAASTNSGSPISDVTTEAINTQQPVSVLLNKTMAFSLLAGQNTLHVDNISYSIQPVSTTMDLSQFCAGSTFPLSALVFLVVCGVLIAAICALSAFKAFRDRRDAVIRKKSRREGQSAMEGSGEGQGTKHDPTDHLEAIPEVVIDHASSKSESDMLIVEEATHVLRGIDNKGHGLDEYSENEKNLNQANEEINQSEEKSVKNSPVFDKVAGDDEDSGLEHDGSVEGEENGDDLPDEESAKDGDAQMNCPATVDSSKFETSHESPAPSPVRHLKQDSDGGSILSGEYDNNTGPVRYRGDSVDSDSNRNGPDHNPFERKAFNDSFGKLRRERLRKSSVNKSESVESLGEENAFERKAFNDSFGKVRSKIKKQEERSNNEDMNGTDHDKEDGITDEGATSRQGSLETLDQNNAFERKAFNASFGKVRSKIREQKEVNGDTGEDGADISNTSDPGIPKDEDEEILNPRIAQLRQEALTLGDTMDTDDASREPNSHDPNTFEQKAFNSSFGKLRRPKIATEHASSDKETQECISDEDAIPACEVGQPPEDEEEHNNFVRKAFNASFGKLRKKRPNEENELDKDASELSASLPEDNDVGSGVHRDTSGGSGKTKLTRLVRGARVDMPFSENSELDGETIASITREGNIGQEGEVPNEQGESHEIAGDVADEFRESSGESDPLSAKVQAAKERARKAFLSKLHSDRLDNSEEDHKPLE